MGKDPVFSKVKSGAVTKRIGGIDIGLAKQQISTITLLAEINFAVIFLSRTIAQFKLMLQTFGHCLSQLGLP